jgi:hypothetical protein
MHIIAILVIAISLVAIAYRNLKLALISLALILIAAMSFYLFSAKNLVANESISDVELSQSKITRGYANGYVLNTRIENLHASQTLQTVLIRSSLSDCNSDQTECLTIGEEDHLVKTRIPPGQARDARINLRMKQLYPIRGEAVWMHEVIKVG